MSSNSKISFYVDTLLVETLLSNDQHQLYKQAGLVSDLLSKVKDYFSSKIDPNNPTGSVLNEIAPGALWVLFKTLGIGKWGLLLGLMMQVFHVDVHGLLASLYNKVKGLVSNGRQTSSEEVDNATENTIQEYNQPGTDQEAQLGYQQLQEQQADDGKVYSSLELFADINLIKLALIDYEHQSLRLTKTAKFANFWKSKAKGVSLLGTIFGWIIKIAFASAGLMVMGDVVNSFIGRPSSLSGTYQAGQSNQSTETSSSSNQTKYPFKNDAKLPDQVPLNNTPENIEEMIIQFAKDVYDGLDGKEQLIKQTPGFQVIKENIDWANIHNKGSRTIIIPNNFTSKKQLVDYFIDDVAKNDH